jgi:hypothetical protein
MRALLPPVMGSLLEYEPDGRRRRVYVTGDTLTGPHLADIARRFAPVDTVVAHLGGTRVLFHTVTMDAPQGVELMRRIPADRTIPVHHDDYRVFRSRVEEFVRLMSRSGLRTLVDVPARDDPALVKATGRSRAVSRPGQLGSRTQVHPLEKGHGMTKERSQRSCGTGPQSRTPNSYPAGRR